MPWLPVLLPAVCCGSRAKCAIHGQSFTERASFTDKLIQDREPQDYDNDALVVHMGEWHRMPQHSTAQHSGATHGGASRRLSLQCTCQHNAWTFVDGMEPKRRANELLRPGHNC